MKDSTVLKTSYCQMITEAIFGIFHDLKALFLPQHFMAQFLAQVALDRLAPLFSLNFLPGLSVHGGNMANTAVTDKTSDCSDLPFLNIL